MPETILAKKRMDRGMAVLRIVTGLLMAYHGLEIFSPEKMEVYYGWDIIKKLPFSHAMVYTGKMLELVSGVLLALGLFTFPVALVMAGLMFFISFIIGNGRFWYEDQHPFLFAMMALVFAFYGPGTWALDNLQKKK